MSETRVDSVLVPLDGSAAARSAIGPALVLARQLACRLELMTVYDAVRDTWEHELDRLAEQTGYEAVEVALVSSSSPADVITAMVREQPGTLVCMATQGRGAVDRMLLGSVTSGVLGAGVSPVLLVGASYAPPDEPVRYRQLVIASDGSGRTAAAALPLARAWVRQLDMAVELLAVDSPSDEAPARAALAPALDGIAEALARDGIKAGCTLIAADRPAEGIAAFVADRLDSLVVVAPRGHTGLRRLLVGSVTAEVLSSSPVPVLVVQQN
jgi:nucleotide-binding universal stress UspA family protein